MRGTSVEASARRRERERCRAIVQSAAGLKQPRLAYALAFNSPVSVAEAIIVLEGMGRGEWAHLNTKAAGAARGASNFRPLSRH